MQAAAESGEDMPLGEDTTKAQTDTVSKTMIYASASNFCGNVLSCLFPILEFYPFSDFSFVGN